MDASTTVASNRPLLDARFRRLDARSNKQKKHKGADEKNNAQSILLSGLAAGSHHLGMLLLLLLLQCSVGHVDAWTPPTNYEDATFATTGSTITGDENFALADVAAFSIRTKFRLNLDHSNYGTIFRLQDPLNGMTILVLHQLGPTYTNTNGISFYFQQGSNSNRCGSVYTTNTWPDPTTELDVVLAYDGYKSKLYVNGALEATGSITTNVCRTAASLSSFRVGSTAGSSAIQGTISFFTVWSGTALSAQQVSEMASDNYANVPSPARHYALNEGGDGTLAYDWMRNGAALTLSNTVTWTNRQTAPCTCLRDMGFVYLGSE